LAIGIGLQGMQEFEGNRRKIRRLAGVARARLAGARWLLAAAAISIGWLAWTSRSSVSAAVTAFLLVTAATLLLPRGRSGARSTAIAADGPAVNELPGSDVVAALPDPVIIFDGNGAVVHANQATIAAFGAMPPGTLLQLRFRAHEMQLLFQGVLGDRRPAVIDHVEKVPIERAFRVSVAPVGNDSSLFLMHFRDQSEVRRIDRMRADFIANASHELRTPLASIAGFIETLRGPARNDETARERFLEIMQAQTGRMARLIDDLLSLSRIEMKPHVRSDERIDIGVLVSSVADALRHLAAENGVVFTIGKAEQPLLVPGSRDELIQVFENLLENACKYGQSGGRVDVEFARSDAGPRQQAVVTIRDYGPGIAEEHIPRITERFYRVDVETSRSQKGTGLGLAIVKHILTRHDGRLVVKSKLGQGAAFAVHLPLD
jgi:two-component system phosphate regulon sensor histidine kinase PhoR